MQGATILGYDYNSHRRQHKHQPGTRSCPGFVTMCQFALHRGSALLDELNKCAVCKLVAQRLLGVATTLALTADDAKPEVATPSMKRIAPLFTPQAVSYRIMSWSFAPWFGHVWSYEKVGLPK